MVKINKKIEYALMVLKHMHDNQNKELVTARDVCDRFHIPFDTTAKVMQQMNNIGYLHSTKGVKGGYTLKANLQNISYLELAELIEGKKVTADCESTNCALLNTCNITGPIKRLNQYLLYFFKDLSLKELLIDSNIGPLAIIESVKQ